MTYEEYLKTRNKFKIEREKKILAEDTRRLNSIPPETQEKIFVWIKANVFPSEGSVLMESSSYGMKHVLEDRMGLYMTNNQFKEAMLRCGFFPIDSQWLNWYYKILKSSPIYKEQKDGRRGLYIPECDTRKKPLFS